MEVINLNLIPNGTNPVVHASQYDEGREFRFNLYDGNTVVTLDGTETIECDVKKPDGNIVTVAVPNTSDSYIVVTTTLQMTACGGNSAGTINITKGGVNIYSKNFLLYCEPSPLENGVESDTAIHNLNTMVDGMVASEVATQYDSANVIFDNEPTSGHGNGYTVTSEGIKTAIDSGLVHKKTASGSIVHIEDGADNIPVKSLASEIVAVQSGSGTPSPSNPRAISGFANGVVSVCGVNIWDEDYELGFWNASGVFSPNTSGYMSSKTHIPVKPNTSICVVIPNNISFYLCRYDKNKNFIDRLTLANPSQRVVQMTSETFYITFSTYQAYGTTYNHDISLNYPSTDTQYHTYNGNDYTITFGQTVYGGQLNVTTGVLEIEKDSIDLGSLNWNYNSDRGLFYALPNANVKKYGNNSTVPDWNCEIYPTHSFNEIRIDGGTYTLGIGQGFISGAGNNCFCVRDDSFNGDYTAFKTAVTGYKLVYDVENVYTVQLTPTEVKTLLGENNIFSNCGDIELTYYTDTDAIYAIRDVIDEFAMQSDWDEADNTKADYIKNKPTIPTNADFSLSGLSDTDITSPSAGQVLAFDGDNWVNSNQIVVKYEEKNITFDSSGEGTLYYANGYILGLKDIPSDSLYIGYITYMAGTRTMIKGFNRIATGFDSSSIASTTRKVGIYYLDYITTQ